MQSPSESSTISDPSVTTERSESALSAPLARVLRQYEQCWPADQSPPVLVSRAPGRLDCMGGMADFSGALALQTTIEPAVYVAVGRRNDQRIHIESIGWGNSGETASCEWPLSVFYQSDGQITPPAELASAFDDAPWVRHILGVCVALLESGDVPHFAGGVTLLVHSEIPTDAGLGSSAAIQVAVAKALADLFEARLSARQLAQTCRMADTDVVRNRPGLVAHMACLLGEPGALLQIRCQPNDVLGVLPLHEDAALAGVVSGVRLPIYSQRYADNRASAMIGRFIIERILELSGAIDDPTGGYLANISPSEYVRRFRNELPVKLRGQDFLKHFGQPEELDVIVEADQVYKVRSRTEHHIYENDRTHRFMERMARARRTGERDALIEAGELMYASHWSYGQRCGMGSIETDVLVNLIREQGPARGFYGAKVTGGGCGGTVAVLMANAPSARQALEETCALYQEKTGKTPSILLGGSPGAMSFNHHRLD